MNQKIWYLIVAILVIVIFVQFYFLINNAYSIRNCGTSTGLANGKFPLSQGKFNQLNSYFEPNLINYWNLEQCSILQQDSMINIVHIKILNNTYYFDCEFGKLYSGANVFQTENNNSVWLGVTKDCSFGTVKEIDSAVRTLYDCRWPMENPIPTNLTDYYAFNIACTPMNVTQELAEMNSTNLGLTDMCRSKITNFANLTYGFGRGFIGVIDANTGRLYQ